MGVKHCAFALLLAGLVRAPLAHAQPVIVDGVVAVVGDRPILLTELRERSRPYLLREGPVFRVGKLEFRGELLGSGNDYEALVSVRPGAVFRRSAIQQDLEAIRQYHLRKGRSELDVQPETALDPATGTVDLTLRIEKRK